MVRIACLILSTVVGSMNLGRDWTEDYGEALSNARCARRPMVVVLENPEKAKQRAGSIFHVEKELLTRFEICRVDVGSDYGKQVASLYSPSELPYTVITDSECDQIVFRGVGERTVREWRATLEDHAEEEADPSTDNSQLASARSLKSSPTKPQSNLNIQPGPHAPFTQGDLTTAKTAARDSSRRLIVYVSMEQCPYCDKMRLETFTNPDVVRLLQKDVESVSIRKEDQAAFVSDHNIAIFPATLVLSPEGTVLTKIEGHVPADVFQSRMSATE